MRVVPAEVQASEIRQFEETFAQHDPMRFGFVLENFLVYATTQFQRRLERIERGAQTRSLELVYARADADVD